MWVHMPHSFDIIRESWDATMIGSPTHILEVKNKKMKEALRYWHRDEVGNIFGRDKLLQSHIESLQTKEANCGITRERKRCFCIW